MIEEAFERIAGCEVVEQVLHGDAGSREDWRTTHDLRVHTHDGFKSRHDVALRQTASSWYWNPAAPVVNALGSAPEGEITSRTLGRRYASHGQSDHFSLPAARSPDRCRRPGAR